MIHKEKLKGPENCSLWGSGASLTPGVTTLLDGESGRIKPHTSSMLTLGKFGTEKAKQPHFPVFCDQRKHFSLIYRWQSNNSLMMSFIFLSVIPRGIPMAVCQINWSGSFLSSHHMMSQTPPFFSSSTSTPPPTDDRCTVTQHLQRAFLLGC